MIKIHRTTHDEEPYRWLFDRAMDEWCENHVPYFVGKRSDYKKLMRLWLGELHPKHPIKYFNGKKIKTDRELCFLTHDLLESIPMVAKYLKEREKDPDRLLGTWYITMPMEEFRDMTEWAEKRTLAVESYPSIMLIEELRKRPGIHHERVGNNEIRTFTVKGHGTVLSTREFE